MAQTSENEETKVSEDNQELLEPKLIEADKYLKPSNQDYLSYYVYQNEWKPTRPLRPIGAMSASPGPAVVNLPSTIGEKNHDPTRLRAPAYKMGLRLPTSADALSSRTGPGPARYDVRDITNMGKTNSRAPKMGKANRFEDKVVPGTMSPGPAAYNREPGDRMIYPTGPSFSMPHSERSKMPVATSNTPGPNAYTLPTAFGPGKTSLKTGPSFSIGKSKRRGFSSKAQSPGPAAYMLPSNDLHMPKAPGFYMGSKLAPPAVSSSSPGPGIYASHLVKFDKHSTPRVTFGIRHSPFKALPGFATEKSTG